ncbi:MAG TPA: bifunctional diguanylate cyclase/phosphodiesterase [Rhodocyclaceae bacterium]|nr:bifunctional diguanylate cyclase/phosphodiesterase [Rhodocyclaceae bacterium]
MDGLTGFLDRVECIGEVERLAGEARAAGASLCVIWIGIDRFRQINSSFGHRAGDNVLAKLAHRMKSSAAEGDLYGRLGGDEFVVLLPGSDLAAAEMEAERIQQVLKAPMEIGQVRFRPSGSMGIAQLNAVEPPLNVLERADRAMLAAKRLGGGQYVVSGEELVPGRFGNPLAREELAVEELIHEALEAGGLSLHYQPILGVGGELDGVEALMRCRVRDQDLTPATFIPVAEKTGLIVRLGEWSLITAARMVQQLHARGNPVKVAVNISRAQLTAPKFCQALHAVLACTDAPASLLELELTESLFMDMSDNVRRNLGEALEAGLPLAIDDFGTGYSCLAYLKDLPAKKIKLDRAFVVGLPEDRKSFAIVRTVAQLARDLGMTVVAEGVETVAQYESLCEAGVMAVQGFLFSRPLAEDRLDLWLQQRGGQ